MSTYYDNDPILTRTVDDDDNAEDRHTMYDWDDNGATSAVLLGETTYDGLVVDPNEILEEKTNTYNARGRLASSAVDDQTMVTTMTFDYDDDGLRVRQTRDDGTTTETREFVFDPQNPTGYAQALEEVQLGTRTVDKAFTVSLDVITQALANAVTGLPTKELKTLIDNGHGPWRSI